MLERLICLDLDGTLEDSRADMTAAVRRVRRAFGLPDRPDAAVRPHVNKGMDQLYRACFDDFLSSGGGLEAVRKAYEADYTARVADETRLYPGVAGALASLRELGRLAVVTNKPEAISRALLKALAVDGLIGTVVGGDSCGGALKPDPVMMRTAARRLNTSGAPAVMVGDTAADVQMGRAFGAKTVWVAWGYAADPGEAPDAVAQRPADLRGTVEALLKIPSPL